MTQQAKKFDHKLKELDTHWRERLRFYMRSVEVQKRRAEQYKDTLRDISQHVESLGQKRQII